ncbi:MAG: hypothetical protein R3B69_02620 [Candidatus Paceibacterota bacterium]
MIQVSASLNQLTVRPVAGFSYATSGAGNLVFYVERGTGHVYQLNLTTGEEQRIEWCYSMSTVAAVFSTDQSHVILTTEQSGSVGKTLLTINGGLLERLPATVGQVHFTGTSTFTFTEKTETDTVVKQQSDDGVQTTQWSTPYQDITVFWEAGGPYVLNRPAPYLKGTVFKNDTQLFPAAFNQTFVPGNQTVLGVRTFYDLIKKRMVSEFVYEDQSTTTAPHIMTPEKCAFDVKEGGMIWCGFDFQDSDSRSREYLSDWYKGVVQAQDAIWVTPDSQTDEALLVVDPLITTGRPLDIIDMTMSFDGEWLLFRNKIDDTLWSLKPTY